MNKFTERQFQTTEQRRKQMVTEIALTEIREIESEILRDYFRDVFELPAQEIETEVIKASELLETASVTITWPKGDQR